MKRKKKPNWKERLKARICDKSGLTLIEVLLTIVIMAIISPIVWSVFNGGQKAYVRQTAEVQFREDADYAVTMIMNEFFATPFDYVESCGTNCIKIVDAKEARLKKAGAEKTTYYDIEKEAKSEVKETEIKVAEEDEKTVLQIKGVPVETESDFKDTTVSFSCQETDSNGKCSSGLIKINMKLGDAKTSQNLDLESEFGF
ncbi:hypothetical protein AC623_14035 [Bacillus sp. FJAT-27231]|uniref:PulJ/GspJ family protein n=1 Tax=Bacillus sp. FJAT-27231 TaxID=1679168 RepID=UPI000670ADE9|nr:type II secretion system protein [Bacillus sp. FJAT-27231]KMY54916.1 hypothetical protein AC623_14035 [Bacillus sp. FJAT-27231]